MVSHQCNVVEEEGEVEGRVRPDIPGDQTQSAGLLLPPRPDVVSPQQQPHLPALVCAVAGSENPLGRDQGASAELAGTWVRRKLYRFQYREVSTGSVSGS